MGDRAAIGVVLVPPPSLVVCRLNPLWRCSLARCVMSPSLASLFPSALDTFYGRPRHRSNPISFKCKAAAKCGKNLGPTGVPEALAGCDPSLLILELTEPLFC